LGDLTPYLTHDTKLIVKIVRDFASVLDIFSTFLILIPSIPR
jgi:hypothetical protein